MSQQEFSYFDPEQETVYQPRNINSDSGEQQERRQEEQPPTYYVTPEQSMLKGEKLTPTSAAKTRSHWGGAAFFVLLMLIGVLIWGTQSFAANPGYVVYPGFQDHHGYSGFYDHDHDGFQGFQSGQQGQGPTAPQTFTISGQPKLVISNTSETIHVKVGDSNTVVLSESSIDDTARNAQSRVVASLVGDNEVNVIGNQFNFGSGVGNELDITVPATTNVEVNNSFGDIIVDNVNGQVQATTTQGNISVSETNLSGSSTLHTESGNIDFNGVLDPKGNYNMQADNGSVSLTLPNDVAFHLLAKNDNGDINNGFSSDSVGSSPQANLTVTASNGDIDIQRANP